MSPVSAAGATCISVRRQIRPTCSASIGGRLPNARASLGPESPGAARGVARTNRQSSGRGCWKMTGGGSGPSVSPAAAWPPSCDGCPASMTSPPPLEGRDADPGALPSAELPRQLADGRRAARGPRRGQRDRQGDLGARAEPRVGRDRLDQPHRDRRVREVESLEDAAHGLRRRGAAPPGGAGSGLHRAARPLQRDADRSVSTPAAAVQVEEPQMEPRSRLDDRAHAWVRRVRRPRAA